MLKLETWNFKPHEDMDHLSKWSEYRVIGVWQTYDVDRDNLFFLFVHCWGGTDGPSGAGEDL